MFDVLIIGAGPSGLCAAKTILECDNARINLRLVDGNKTVGGVWAKENIYTGLRTNNLRGGIDFTDFPMHDGFGVEDGQPIPGQVMHEYLRQYAEKWDIPRRIDFETRVVEISRLSNVEGWNVKVEKASGVQATQDMQTKKLIVATGITNQPHSPHLDGAESFDGPIIHSAEMGKKADMITKDPQLKTVAVIAGAKSAYDAVSLAASAGKQVEWIIRKSGKGPAWVSPPYTKLGPVIAWRERLPVRRFVSCFSPWFWKDGMGWLRNFLHFTSLGKKIAQAFWSDIHHATLRDCQYAADPALNTLQPEQSPFWYGTLSGSYNYPPKEDVYHYIRSGAVRVRRTDTTHLTSHTLHLSDGTTLSADAIIAATGFNPKPNIAFFPSDSHSDLGIPTTSYTPAQRERWKQLNHQAELTIAASYPRLLLGPFKSPSSNTIQPFNPGVDAELGFTPWRLYRAIAPPGPTSLAASAATRNLVFIGMFSNIAAAIRLELQCLWAYAYLNDSLTFQDQGEHVWAETALFSRFWKYRAPYGHGRFYPDAVFDQLGYFDTLLQDLGLKFKRKSNWFKELFAPYTQADYRGIVQEWLQNQRQKTEEATRQRETFSTGVEELRQGRHRPTASSSSASENGWMKVEGHENTYMSTPNISRSTTPRPTSRHSAEEAEQRTKTPLLS